MSDARPRLDQAFGHRILVLDGAMGTMVQAARLEEADYRGEGFRGHPRPLKGCNDLLVLTQPELIERIHFAYLESGADLIETDTFNATSIALADYGLESRVYEINRAAAALARRAADRMSERTPARPRFVAGSIGPTNRTASLSPDVNRPGFRAVGFDDLERAYHEQVRGLVDGGVDLLLPETSFDTLNLKAALFAIERYFDEHGVRLPVIASLTITDASGRTLSGQTVEAAYTSIAHANLLAVGVNCALGPEQMRPHVEELSRLAPRFVHCYPNAGLPNEFGGYDESPERVAAVIRDFAERGWVNLVGGCCGTTPDHIRAIAEAVANLAPRVPPRPDTRTRFAGLEPYVIRPDSNFTMIGERTNITGSRRFARLVREGDLETALEVARDQVEGGANLLDVNMDEGLIDAEAMMTRFLHLIGSEPEIARLPIMIDSSRFSVLEAGLKCLQGKGVVNSLSLKEGEAEFLRQARLVRRYGAAVVVMAFDEEGQAATTERRVAILARAHRLLTEQVGFPPEDVIFDPNVLTVATGIEEHEGYAVSYLEAVRELKRRFPATKISGGISNISFSFRGNDRLREAMHAAFLYHAIRAGIDMGIVNAGQLAVYDDVPPELLERVEDVLLARRPDATERLVEFAGTVRGPGRARERDDAWRALPIEARLGHALVHGVADHVDEDVAEALKHWPTPLAIIEGPLMAGMNVVGDLFGAGKMFLPQVVKSARVMKKAVALLEPRIAAERKAAGDGRQPTRIVLATVKGDVHDIGKNIVGVVLGCNGYDIVDLGVMVPAERILDEAIARRADLVGLSGLITPSLDEMVHVAGEMERRGMRLPLLIGGATTSRKHTALRIAPRYSGPTAHVTDASRAVDSVGQIVGDSTRESYVRRLREEQQADRDRMGAGRREELLPYPQARAARPALDWSAHVPERPAFTGLRVLEAFPLDELVATIDWTPFFHVWELRGVFPKLLDDPARGAAARELYDHARAMLDRVVTERWLTARGVYGFFPAAADGDDVIVFEDDARAAERTRLHFLRQQRRHEDGRPRHALSDFVAPREGGPPDWIGAFAVTAGHGIDARVAAFERDHDDYSAILLKALADRLAEAFAERLHAIARADWGYGKDERLALDDLIHERYRGIRPAPGYPACPDHTEKRTLWELLGPDARAGITLTESFAMLPAAAVSGWYFGHPQAQYFAVGPIGRDQVEDYARRKALPVAEVERWLGPNLGYDPRGG